MNNTFDIKRLGMLMRWDILSFWKHYVYSTLACIISYTLYSLVLQNNYKGVAMLDGTSVGIQNQYFTNEALFFIIMIFIAFYVWASCIFCNLKTKTYRESFLMLPASNLEKYMARLLLMVIVSIVELTIILIATDAIQMAFSYINNSEFHVSITLPVIHETLDTFTLWGEETVIFYSSLIFAHSFCIVGGTFYRKMAPLFTFFTWLALCMVFGYLVNWMGNAGLLNLLSPYNDGHNYVWTTVLCILLLALSAFNYWASYKIFTRMQVISNKWINI